jgi:hypothetical protein|nr:MAG TPA: PORTAL PROTEIN [Caudoviricetes sp.]
MTETVNMAAPPNPAGLTASEKDQMQRLYETWSKKLGRNIIKKRYYRQKNKLKDLGISIPPQLRSLETCLGWPAKAVDMLAVRSRFDGFVYEDSEVEGIERILTDNRFRLMYPQAVSSELIHSCAFITVSAGAAGEPPVLVSFYSAENGAVIWDSRRKRVECGMTIVEVDDKTKAPTWVNLYTDEAVIEMRKGAVWTANRLPHSQGRPLIEPLFYRPDLDRPMGRSRITRTVMSITDSAMRACLRSEVSAEFFTSPQKYALGVSDELIERMREDGGWSAYVGNIFAMTDNPETGERPTFGQLAQGSMEPHISYLRNLSCMMAAETNCPITAFGIVQDNPSSAEAIRAAENYLIIEAESLNDTNGEALRNVGLLVHAIAAKTTVDRLDDSIKSIRPKFKNPSMPSAAAQADAMVKRVSTVPWLAETDVCLEELGFDEGQIVRIKSDKKRIDREAILEKIAAQPDVEESGEDQEANLNEQ